MLNRQIRVGIVGYGNIAKGAEKALQKNQDMQLVSIFSRREPSSIKVKDPNVKVVSVTEIEKYKQEIDVLILCGGSANDLPVQGPSFAQMFNTVDSFDIHAKIPEYFAAVNTAAKGSGKTSIISVGWDPGLFSINRMLGEAVLPGTATYTFWGKGVSQGHSNAIRKVKGVKAGIQYTIPREEALKKVRTGENPNLTAREKHLRQCYVVPEENADQARIAHEIKTMPDYFAEYDTEVIFISEEEFKANHSHMSHGGIVINTGRTGDESNKQIMEFSLKLDSNPEFTGSILVAYARAAYRLNQAGQIGAKTVLDIPPALLSSKSPEELCKNLL
jgi:diaminopimelate dehydrogenase